MMTDQYDQTDHLELSAEQLALMLEPTRRQVLDLLNDGPATVKQLARALGRPPSSIAHHCDALADAGLVYVERTRRVRAIDERFYARTARTFILTPAIDGDALYYSSLREAVEEHDRSRAAGLQHAPDGTARPGLSTFRIRRIPDASAAEFATRLQALADEFIDADAGGDVRYGLALAIFPTTRPAIDRDDDAR